MADGERMGFSGGSEVLDAARAAFGFGPASRFVSARPRAVLLSMPRTGSTMITRRMHRHPHVIFVGAIFSEKGWWGKGAGMRAIKEGLGPEWDSLQYRIAHREELLAKVWALGEHHACVGLKHHLSGAPDLTDAVIDDLALAKIVLNRDNLLACYSSDKMVRVKAALKEDPNGPAKATFVGVDFGRYIKTRRRLYDRWVNRIDSSGSDVLHIRYVHARTNEGMAEIAAFLGVSADLMSATVTAKRNSDVIVDRFQNPDDAWLYLKDNGLEFWAEER